MKMISNYLYRTHFWFLGLVAAVFVLAGCSEETFVEPVSKETTLTLHFSRMEQVTTRVNDTPNSWDSYWCEANSNEHYVERCALLFYDWRGQFIDMHELYSDNINNASGETVIRLNKLMPSESENIVVLCNYDHINIPYGNISDLKSHLAGNSSISVGSCNGFGMGNGKGIPMFGFVPYASESGMMCEMYFSVAKIQLALTEDTYSDWYEYSWSLCNVPVYTDNIYTVSVDDLDSWDYVTPCFPTNLSEASYYESYDGYNVGLVSKDRYTGRWTVEHLEPTPDKTYYCYSPELQNSTRTVQGKVVDANTFDKYRTCLILRKRDIHSDKEWYYRIDFLTGNGKDETKQFFDILRNRHYVVTVTKMSEAGYATYQDALNNPPSNIEYSIDGSTEEYVTSNGQYGLGFTQEWNVLTYFEDDVIGKEITLGYVKAIYEDGTEYKITPNDINITLNDNHPQNVEGFTLSEPDQQITSERMPIKIKLNTRPEGSMGWGCEFYLNLKLGNITRSFLYSFRVQPTIPSEGYLGSYGREPLKGGIVSLEDIPDSFINIWMLDNSFSLQVPENPTSTPRAQEALLSAYGLKGGIFRYKFIVTQKGKE